MSTASRNPFRQATFVLSAPELRQLPADDGAEITFAGRSNAGKSSALNAICDQTGLARTSKTPGRTQQFVVFALGAGQRKVIDAYLRERQSLRAVVLIIDCRHPLKEFDRQMLDYCRDIGLPCHVLLAKADKLSRNQGSSVLAAVRRESKAQGWPATVQLFSAHAGTGLDEARMTLYRLLNAAPGVMLDAPGEDAG